MSKTNNFRMLIIWIMVLFMAVTLVPAESLAVPTITLPLSRSTIPAYQRYCVKPTIGNIQMSHTRDGPSDSSFLFQEHERRSRSLDPDEELLSLEEELRQRQLWYRPDIQWWYRVASVAKGHNRAYSIRKLQLAIEGDRIECMRYPGYAAFWPLGPEVLLSRGDLALLRQVVDRVHWKVPMDTLLRGAFIAGPQGSGKSRLIAHICRYLATKGICFLVIDPKSALAPFSEYLDAVVVDISELSLDLSPPGNMTYRQWLTEYLPYLAADLGIIQGTDILLTAGHIAIELRERRIKETGKPTELCLHDIFASLSSVHDTERGRREGYRQGLQTVLSRLLLASQDLFSCRRGAHIRDISRQNTIVTASTLTDPLACRVFATYPLIWKQADARGEPESNRLRHLIVIDDAHRYISASLGQSDPASVPTSMTHLLALLRSSGTGLLAASQLPSQVDPGVIALSNLIIVVGGLHDVDGQRVIGNVMSLSTEARQALVGLSPRLAVGFCCDGVYRRPVIGWTFDVPDPEGA